MKIKCNREKLLSAFQTAAMVAPSRSPKAVLQNVRISSEPAITRLMATDMEVGVLVDVADVETEVTGNALLSVGQFGSILRESSDDFLRIEADGSGIMVYGDRSKFKLPSNDPESFPTVPDFLELSYHEVQASLLKELIRRTLFATDPESSRYALGGILLELDEEKIIAVGTDGRRLAKMEGSATSVNGHQTGEAMTIVPSRTMQLVERTMTDGDGVVRIAARGNDILIQSKSTTLSSRLVEGRFPRWRDVIPTRTESVDIEMTAGPLYAALRQASIVASSESRGIDFTFAGGSLVLAGTTADVGESRVELPISFDGDEIKLCLDHRYVSDFLRVLNAESTFTLNVLDGDNAAVYQTDDGYNYVVMPLAREKAAPAAASAGATS